MKTNSFVKKAASFTIMMAFVSIMLSSCYRGGYGCPNKITDYPSQNIEVEDTLEPDC